MKDKSEIKTVWVDSEIGEQMMFAVPMEYENEPVVDNVDEIKKEIMRYLDDCITESEKILNRGVDYSYTFKCILNTDIDANIRAKEEILKIFEKY